MRVCSPPRRSASTLAVLLSLMVSCNRGSSSQELWRAGRSSVDQGLLSSRLRLQRLLARDQSGEQLGLGPIAVSHTGRAMLQVGAAMSPLLVPGKYMQGRSHSSTRRWLMTRIVRQSNMVKAFSPYFILRAGFHQMVLNYASCPSQRRLVQTA